MTCQQLRDDAQTPQVGGFLWFIPTSFIARLMIASLFVITGILSIMDFNTFSANIAKLGIPYVTLVAVIALIMKIFGGILFTGILAIPNGVSVGRLALLLFLFVSTVVTNNSFKDPTQLTEMLTNIALMGGLLLA